MERPKRYPCETCGKAYSRPSRLREHERSHEGVRPFGCPHCEKRYFRKEHLAVHLTSHADDRAPFACAECGARFTNRAHLLRHRNALVCSDGDGAASAPSSSSSSPTPSLPPLPIPCEVSGCFYAAPTEGCLATHLATHAAAGGVSLPAESRGNVDALRCRMAGCAFPSFASRSALVAHQRSAHRELLHCALCDRYFHNPHNLQAHRRLHDPRRVFPECGECGKSFATQRSLATHQRAVHGGLRPHACELCGATYIYRKNLKEHMERHAELAVAAEQGGDGPHSPRRAPARPLPDIPCPAEGCNVVYKRVAYLRKHIARAHPPNT